MKNPILTCQDHIVSNESFRLFLDEELDMLITSPQPKISDLGKYYESENYISHTDSKQSLIDKIYQLVKKYTVSKKVNLIDNLVDFELKEKRLLDIGCGTGDFLSIAQMNNWKVNGVEPNPNARIISESKTKLKIYTNILELDSVKYDVITLWHVLEHIPNLFEYISQLKNLLSDNGTLIIAVPNFKSYDAQYYGNLWAAYDVPRHLWHFSKTSISRLFKKENMKVVKVKPMLFDSFYVSLLSEKYKTGKQNLFRAFFIGLRSNLKGMLSKEYSSHIYIIKNL